MSGILDHTGVGLLVVLGVALLLTLVRLVRGPTIADRVVVSIFVNPTQFGPNEDYASYPRTPEEDAQALMEADTDLLFLPAVEEIYPPDLSPAPYVAVPEIDGILCGEFRPGHFSGVATVVAKLFSLVQPDVAVFGEKDYQQLIVIRRMARALCLPVAIEGMATVREASGLAMSSRNRYLSEAERDIAATLYRVLCEVRDRVEGGASDYPALETAAAVSSRSTLKVAGVQLDPPSIVVSTTPKSPTAMPRLPSAEKRNMRRLVAPL